MKDIFGFEVDSNVGYARGEILDGIESETNKMFTGRKIIKKRVKELGRDSVYNMTGLSRSVPLSSEDIKNLKSQVEFHANYEGELEKISVPFVGADPKTHTSILLNRITSSMIAIMGALAKEGESVVSWVPGGRSHPSVENACNIYGIRFHESTDLNTFKDLIKTHKPVITVITPLTHAKIHADLEDTTEAVKIANEGDAIVLLDDAHMPARVSVFQEPPTFKLGNVDLGTLSPDKHMWGPRAGLLTGREDLIRKIAAEGFSNGLDAQSSHYVSVINAIKTFDPHEIEEAGDLAKELLSKINNKFKEAEAYLAGPGIGMSEYNLYKIVYKNNSNEQAYKPTPIEVSAAVNMEMLRTNGIVTIPTVGMPGSSPSMRLMMFSDGGKMGVDKIINSFEQAIKTVRKAKSKQDIYDLIFKI